MQETWVWSLDWEDCLEKGMVTHSSILVWRITMDRGAWRTVVHGVTNSRTWLNDYAQHSTAQSHWTHSIQPSSCQFFLPGLVPIQYLLISTQRHIANGKTSPESWATMVQLWSMGPMSLFPVAIFSQLELENNGSCDYFSSHTLDSYLNLPASLCRTAFVVNSSLV